MVALSVAGVLVGLVSPLLLGVLVNALVDRNDRREAALLAVAIAVATLAEARAIHRLRWHVRAQREPPLPGSLPPACSRVR